MRGISRKGVPKIEELVKDLGSVLRHILKPGNLATLVTLWGIVRYSISQLTKRLDKRQDEMINLLSTRIDVLESYYKKSIDDVTVEVLRVQILTGIDQKRLSRSELSYFFDKYKKLGGNSFVEDKVHEYLRRSEKEDELWRH